MHNANCPLKYKAGWTDAQKAEADAKVAALNQSPRTVTTVPGRTNQKKTWEKVNGPAPTGTDIDHVIDLQLGGVDNIINYSPLDSSVNRSLGKQINNFIRNNGLKPGDVIDSFQIK